MLKQLQFFSVASDGRVTLWTLAKSELLHQVSPHQHFSAAAYIISKSWSAARQRIIHMLHIRRFHYIRVTSLA